MKVEVHGGLDAVGADVWDDLLTGARLRSPFLSWIWQREWVRSFAAGRRIDARRVVDASGFPVALLPLYESSPGVMTLVGGAEVSDYLDVLALAGREEDVWDALLESRAAERVAWELHAVPAASPTVAVVPALAPAHGLRGQATVEERCPVLTLPGTWEEYLAALPGKHRHELTRKIRRFEREEPDARVAIAFRPADIESTRTSGRDLWSVS